MGGARRRNGVKRWRKGPGAEVAVLVGCEAGCLRADHGWGLVLEVWVCQVLGFPALGFMPPCFASWGGLHPHRARLLPLVLFGVKFRERKAGGEGEWGSLGRARKSPGEARSLLWWHRLFSVPVANTGLGAPRGTLPRHRWQLVPGGGRDTCKNRDCLGHPPSGSFIAESGAR